MNIKTREMRREDLGEVLALLGEFAEYEKLSEYCTATVERFDAALFAEGSIADGIVLLNGEAIVGYALFYPNFSTFRGERGIYLEDLYIQPAFRGGGSGKLMIKKVAAIAAERGFERMDFQVLDWNETAITFYRKLGAESNDDETHFKFAGNAFERLASQSKPPV